MTPRIPLPDPGPFGTWVRSFDIHLRSEQKAKSTVRGYTEAAVRLAGWLLAETDVRTWDKVTKDHIKRYQVWMGETVGYSLGHQANQYRCLQQFWRWYAEEEDVPGPMAGIKAPPTEGKLVPVLTAEQLTQLIRDAESRKDFEHRRDAAILRLFASSGARLSEIANLSTEDVDLGDRTAFVRGKGRKERHVKFDHRATQALDRYIRVRSTHKAAHLPALWLGVRRQTGMTPSGLYQVITRRGERLGIELHPHMFRHTFSHAWLDNGGAEGDLMELNGWTSPQMLRRYGASARKARAQRAYDRVDVMGGI
jgi:site-specific recombinase XerD